MEQLCQSIRFRFHLAPLNEEDIAAYIKHRLSMAGYNYTVEEEGQAEPIVHPECYPVIHRYTGGIPRLINALFDTVLITAFVEQEKNITLRRSNYQLMNFNGYLMRSVLVLSTLQKKMSLRLIWLVSRLLNWF